jgi:hypothetical protein
MKKEMVGYTNSGKEVWKTIPAIKHSFKTGDLVNVTMPIGGNPVTCRGIVLQPDYRLSNPYNWNSRIELMIRVKLTDGVMSGKSILISQDDPEQLDTILLANKV